MFNHHLFTMVAHQGLNSLM